MTAILTRPIVGPAVPAGYRPAVHPMLWVAAVSEAAEFEHRSDAVTRRTDLAWVLVDHTDWTTRTVACGWTLLAATAHLSRRTLGRSLAWLRTEHLLATVSSGSRASGHSNDPAIYLLLEAAPHL
jgi:hypothetical protein